MYILGWLSDVERDKAVVYHLRDTHILAPRCHNDKQMGIPAKSEDLTKSLALFYEVQVIKLLAELVYLKTIGLLGFLLSSMRLGRCNSIQLEAILKYVCSYMLQENGKPKKKNYFLYIENSYKGETTIAVLNSRLYTLAWVLKFLQNAKK